MVTVSLTRARVNENIFSTLISKNFLTQSSQQSRGGILKSTLWSSPVLRWHCPRQAREKVGRVTLKCFMLNSVLSPKAVMGGKARGTTWESGALLARPCPSHFFFWVCSSIRKVRAWMQGLRNPSDSTSYVRTFSDNNIHNSHKRILCVNKNLSCAMSLSSCVNLGHYSSSLHLSFFICKMGKQGSPPT